ncbi:cell wall synthesis protein Wag31-like [Panicum virgatum]|uniref:cell wall synthesis protein Wag31-like n=1 Tax=Panicum virgatum TaxID=38727 RepID=UPI0019D56457|nr:cell wall synthesis protein Wag31-like [Panicum virgatum]
MSFLQDVHPEVTDALLGFVYDPLDPANAALDDLLSLPPHDDDDAFLRPIHGDGDGKVERHCAKRQRACGDGAWRGLARIGAGQQSNGGGNQQVPEPPNELVLPLPLPSPPQLPEPPALVRVADANKAAGNVSQSVQSAAARQRRKRISEKTAELSRLIPGGRKMNTAEMLEEAARHVKLLQAQVGVLALMRTNEKVPSMVQEQMYALLVRGSVQERLAAEGKCLVPRKLVDAVASDSSVKSNALVSRDLGRFVASLQAGR